jgi:hypothetical protein
MKRQSYIFYGYYYFVTMANEGVLKAAAVLGPRLFCFYMILAFYIMGKGVAHDR